MFHYNSLVWWMEMGIIILLPVTIFLLYLCYLEKLVARSSNRYLAYQQLVNKYEFNQVTDVIKYNISVDTKAKYDRFNFDKRVYTMVSSRRDRLEEFLAKVVENRKLYKAFMREYNKLPAYSGEDKGNTEKQPILYKTVEKMMLKRAENEWPIPTTDIILACIKTYTSPHGRNCYTDTMTYTMDKIESYIRQSYAEEEKKTSKEYQRQLLTPSLRYDIMKRDGFRCVLCGRTSKDGIALHVDHILPVSKGGQTIPSNLRTLCDVCNLGKSDKYDNDGLN